MEIFKIAKILLLFFATFNLCFAEKDALYESIEQNDDAMWDTAQKIWTWAEPGYQETKSSKLLADTLEAAGFHVSRGVAEIPTAFTAEYGSGPPVIGILGEYDALPGLSQQNVPWQMPRDDVTYGHGCGHHLIGVASAWAAIAIAERIKAGDLQGTVRFYGCPAEEGGSAKVFMVRAGLFKDCDAVLRWHPNNKNSAGDSSSLARIAVKFRFHGKSAHAAISPQLGRSALDAVELTNHAVELMREHTPDRTRIHHVITAGGSAPNVVPDFAEVYYYIRHPKAEVVRPLYERLVLCAKAGALATETLLEIDFQGGLLEIIPNNTLAQVSMANLKALNNIKYDQQDTQFAIRLQQSLNNHLPLNKVRRVFDRRSKVGMGSTDVGDVSWIAPTTGFTTACWVPGTPAHSWQAVACGNTPIARKGMRLASKVLAATTWDLLTQPMVLDAAKQEHRQHIGKKKYQTLMQPNQKPPLDYRKPPKANR